MMNIQLQLVLIEYKFSALVDENNDLNEDQSIPVNKESLVECEIQKDTEISSCLQNKGMCLSILNNFFLSIYILNCEYVLI